MKYEVNIPIVGSIMTVVEADSKEDAIDKAVQRGFQGDIELCEIDTVRHVCKGDVCYAPLLDAEACEE